MLTSPEGRGGQRRKSNRYILIVPPSNIVVFLLHIFLPFCNFAICALHICWNTNLSQWLWFLSPGIDIHYVLYIEWKVNLSMFLTEYCVITCGSQFFAMIFTFSCMINLFSPPFAGMNSMNSTLCNFSITDWNVLSEDSYTIFMVLF